MQPPTQPIGPLAGVLVVDLTRALAGPHATMMLGDLGARVVKVEAPGHGDDSRTWGPPFLERDGERTSTYFLAANRNKESLTLDLKDTSEGGDRAVLEELVRRADVLVENFRVGVMDRLGLGVDRLHELNPGLVVLSITGFGHDGPEAMRAGYDQIAQGEGGLMSLTGDTDPTKTGVPIADLLAGMNGAYGVAAALFERERARAAGEPAPGRVVRTSLLSSVVGVHAYQGTRWTAGHEVPGLQGTHHAAIAPYGLFHTATSPVQVACGSEGLWRAFAPVVGLDPAEARFATNLDRVTNREELTAAIEAAMADAPAEDWLERLASAGVPSGKVRSVDDVYRWEQTLSQGLLIGVEHPVHGTVQLPGSALRLDDQPFSGGRAEHLAPPLLGQHDAALRGELGFG
ncbi:CoA transferase [Nocardioides sp. HDW12B]|uniref:CaiB/BaiF CoA transferase family protein n=1 Tax=Nocardioides sp. HDW12B TaxID=2714939 RepID=UPI001407985F|nr:CoA transferase [Nocardioides sp. HDW12B]QIK67406.1 CoA transferase [Nocardioides sp. HDW12B]